MTEEETQIEHVEVAAVEANAIELMERASVDVQIATAHRYPRNIDKFIEKAKKMVSVDPETAESCIYRRPVGKDGDAEGQKYVEGESIRLAEIVAANYGNLRVGVIISEMNPRYVKAIGFAHDLESNVANKAEVVESTVTKWGKPYSERMRLVVAKAAQSKARRDAIFSVVPKSLCKPIIETARHIIAGHQRPIGQRQNAVKLWISKLSIDPERIYAALNVSCVSDMGDEELETLTGIRTALRDGEITLDEAFPADFDTTKHIADKNIKEQSGSVPVDTDLSGREAEGDQPPADGFQDEEDPATKAEAERQKVALADGQETVPGSFACKNPKCEQKGVVFSNPKMIKKGRTSVPQCSACLGTNVEAVEEAA